MIALWLSLAAVPVGAEDAIAFPANEQVPFTGETDVPVNSALVMRRFSTPRAVLVTPEGETILQLETALPGITVVRLPEQAPNTQVRVRLEEDFDNDNIADTSEEISWTTGTRRVEPGRPPELKDARIEQPFLEQPRAVVEAEPDVDRAVLALFRVDGVLRTLVNAQFGSTQIADFGYQSGNEDYALVGVDRTGAVSEPTPVDVGGCGAGGAGSSLSLLALFASLGVKRARRRALRAQSVPEPT